MFGTFEKIEQHITAGIYIFQQEDYQVINPQSDLDQVDDLQDEVRMLISERRPNSMEIFLRGVEYTWPRRENSANQTATQPMSDTAKRSSVWYLSWRKNGEVEELIAAFPMQIQLKYDNPMDEVEIMHVHAARLVAEGMEIDNFIEKHKKY